MNMNLVGYLVTLANLQGFDRSGGAIQDLSIKVGEIHSLLYDLGKYPQFPLNSFKDTGYYRNGNTGIYLSKNMRDYMYHGIGKPSDEAILLTLIFNDSKKGGTATVVNDPTLSYFLHKGEVDDDIRNKIDQYVDNLKNGKQGNGVSNSAV